MEIECAFAKSCIKQFWQGTLGGFIHDEIVLHLLICDDCFVDYIYSAVTEFNYGIDDIIAKVKPLRETVAEKYKDELLELIEDIKVELKIAAMDMPPKTAVIDTEPAKLKPIVIQNCFMNYFSTFDLQGLLMLRSFKDLCNEFNSEKPFNDDNPKSKFYKFLTKKICQRVDFLEKCYKLDYSGNE